MMWFLAREVLRIRGIVSRDAEWDACVDLFFARDPSEIENIKAQEAAAEAAPAEEAAPEAENGWTEVAPESKW